MEFLFGHIGSQTHIHFILLGSIRVSSSRCVVLVYMQSKQMKTKHALLHFVSMNTWSQIPFFLFSIWSSLVYLYLMEMIYPKKSSIIKQKI